MEFWEQFSGRVIDGWEIARLVSANGPIAVFAVRRPGTDDLSAVGAMKLLLLTPEQIEDQLRQWQIVSELSHANLMPVLAYGKTELEGAPAAYIVTEFADDNLSTALQNRALTEKETGEVLEPLLAAVGYLHSKGVVHSRIRPSNILALGDNVKLSSDSVLPEGQMPVFARERDGYDAPELADSPVPSAASDVWSLGALLVEATNQAAVDEKYAAIIAHTHEPDPQKRWSIGQIQAAVSGAVPVVPPAPMPEPFRKRAALLEPEREPEPEPKRDHKYALIAAIAAAVLLAVFLLARKPHVPAPAPVAPIAAATPSVSSPDAGARVQPAPRAAVSKSGNRWFVVVATYGRKRDAEKRAKSISRKFPHFHARVFEPPVENPHHLVVIGENLSRDAALSLQQRARAAGLPRDVYVKQFVGA